MNFMKDGTPGMFAHAADPNWMDETDEVEPENGCDCEPGCEGPHEERRPIGGPYLYCFGCRKCCA